MKQYEAFDAMELYCPKCRTARPVHRRLLLVLPTGNTYEYRCSVCGTVLGGKNDTDDSEYREILRRSGRLTG